jgi:hypothetical protein
MTKEQYLKQLNVLHERLGGCVFPLVTARKWSLEYSRKNDKLLAEAVEKIYVALSDVATVLDNEQKNAK